MADELSLSQVSSCGNFIKMKCVVRVCCMRRSCSILHLLLMIKEKGWVHSLKRENLILKTIDNNNILSTL